jgi:hypothetical protein
MMPVSQDRPEDSGIDTVEPFEPVGCPDTDIQ